MILWIKPLCFEANFISKVYTTINVLTYAFSLRFVAISLATRNMNIRVHRNIIHCDSLSSLPRPAAFFRPNSYNNSKP